ncbi:membrane dipeptidase [Candidatus Kaiserbacteria bacterium]|nr:membrane dipeptidase [Candidatus Kaiserbacteria bacterium]
MDSLGIEPFTKADSMGFLAPRFDPPIIDKRSAIDLALVTSAPPVSLTDPAAPPSLKQTLAKHREFIRELLAQWEIAHLVLSREDLDIPECIRVVCGLQSPPIGARPQRIAQILWEVGIRVVNLSGYEGPHQFGAGFAEPRVGLTLSGRRFVRACAKVGLIGDVSHMSHQCIRDTFRLIDKEQLRLPLMASHVGCCGVHAHDRSLPDDILQEIFVRGGYVGIVGMAPFLSTHDTSIEPFFRHLEYALAMAKKVRSGFVGFGSDVVYRDQVQDEDRSFPREWVEQETQIPQLIQAEMRKRGFDLATRQGVLGANFLRFLRLALPEK